MTIKTAICIPKSVVFPEGVDHLSQDVYIKDHNVVLGAVPTLEDRATCEKDPSLLQIIPYITLFDKKTKKIFIYSRGEASGEQRLAGKCSIGLGGHMETPPGDMLLSEIIVEEGLRELEEEIGIEITDDLRQDLESKLFHGDVGFMYNSRTEVDRLHLAVAFFVEVDADAVMGKTHEAGVITKGEFLSIADIQSNVANGTFEVEHWTRMVLESLQYGWSK